jgi:hypothetical protein
MTWIMEEVVAGGALRDYQRIVSDITQSYRHDGLSDDLVSQKMVASLAFNILLLSATRLELRLGEKTVVLDRSLCANGDYEGLPIIYHVVRDRSDTSVLICAGLLNAPLAFYQPSTGSLQLSRYADSSDIEIVRRVIDQLADWRFDTEQAMTGPAACVALYASPYNYIHDLTNMLPGFHFATKHIDSISVVLRNSFFGHPARYAEMSCGVTNADFAHYNLTSHLTQTRVILARPVSFYLPPDLLAEIRGEEPPIPAKQRPVVLAVRGQNRLCLNESAFFVDLMCKLAALGIERFVIVGWIWPTNSSQFYRKAFASAAADADRRVSEVVSAARQFAYVRGLSGWEMSDAIPVLRSCRSYVSPCGTINHLLNWISGAPGVIFGQQSAITQAKDWNDRSIGGNRLVQELSDEFISSVNDSPRSDFSIDLSCIESLAETIVAMHAK